MRILIAEDDAPSRMLLSVVLKQHGYEVIETTNGAQAWEILQQPEPPELAIVDWMMPELDGVEVIRRVRSRNQEAPTYIIMLTSRVEKADIVAGLDAGANDYLAKPFDKGELRARVEVGRRMIEMQQELLESRRRIAHEAAHDSLTGLMNRRAILNQLGTELARAERNRERLAVAMCDIDHFKRINDTYGHQTGDEVLRGFAALLRESLRGYDAIGRIGGEEFLLVTPLGGDHDPVSMFQRLCALVAESGIPTRSGELSVTMSIGVAEASDGCTVDQVLAAADDALYSAKNGGRNRAAQAV